MFVLPTVAVVYSLPECIRCCHCSHPHLNCINVVDVLNFNSFENIVFIYRST